MKTVNEGMQIKMEENQVSGKRGAFGVRRLDAALVFAGGAARSTHSRAGTNAKL